MSALSTTSTNTESIGPSTATDPLPAAALAAGYWAEVAAGAPRAARATSVIGLVVVLMGVPTEFEFFAGGQLRTALFARGALVLFFVASFLVAHLRPKWIQRQYGWWVVALMLAVSGSMTTIGVMLPAATHWYFLGVIEAEIAAATFLRIPRRKFIGGMIAANALYVTAFVTLAPNPGSAASMVAISMTVMAVLVGFAQYTIVDSSMNDYAQRVALDRERRNVATILSSITNAFWTLDERWRFRYFNPEAERLLTRMQRNKEVLIGRNIWEEFPNLAADSLMHDEFNRVVASGEPVKFEEYYPLMDVHLEVHAYPSEGGVAVYCNDITARKSAEAALQDAYTDLEQRVRERTQELRELFVYIDSVREEEQARIGREIHDHLGQLLSLLKMEVAMVRKSAATASGEISDRIESLDELIRDALQATRELAATLRPRILDDLGLLPALEWLLQRVASSAKLSVSLQADPPELALDPDRSTALFRIVQEGLANVVRHARAHEVRVDIRRVDEVVELELADDGVGLGGAAATGGSDGGGRGGDGVPVRRGMGLLNMRERAARFGGTTELRALSNGGSVLYVRIPLGPEEVAIP